MKYISLIMLIAILIIACDRQEDPTPAKACFDFTPTDELHPNDEISFTNCSQDAKTYLWVFGDGNISIEESPKHSYVNGGEYGVSLIAYGEKNDTLTKTIEINVIVPTACFSFTPNTDIYTGDEITFTNCSENAKTYFWDFDNGDISTLESPSYTYFEAGTYEVELYAEGDVTDSITKNIVVHEYSNNFTVDNETYDLHWGITEYYGAFLYGEHNHDLILASDDLQLIFDAGEIEGIEGIGEIVYFEMFSSSNKLAEGTYTYSQSNDPFTFDEGTIYVGYDGMDEEAEQEFDLISGTVTIEKNETLYFIDFDCTSLEGLKITGSYTGALTSYDYSGDYRKKSKNGVLKK